jgi:hypothetical protein
MERKARLEHTEKEKGRRCQKARMSSGEEGEINLCTIECTIKVTRMLNTDLVLC